MRHPNVLQLLGYCNEQKKNQLWLVTELIPNGSLASHIYVPNRNPRLDGVLIVRIAMDIVRGMMYLHKENVLHRDLKAANILVISPKIFFF